MVSQFERFLFQFSIFIRESSITSPSRTPVNIEAKKMFDRRYRWNALASARFILILRYHTHAATQTYWHLSKLAIAILDFPSFGVCFSALRTFSHHLFTHRTSNIKSRITRCGILSAELFHSSFDSIQNCSRAETEYYFISKCCRVYVCFRAEPFRRRKKWPHSN